MPSNCMKKRKAAKDFSSGVFNFPNSITVKTELKSTQTGKRKSSPFIMDDVSLVTKKKLSMPMDADSDGEQVPTFSV